MKTVIIVAIVIAVLAVIAVIAYLASRRRATQRRHRAGQLRTKADAQTGAVDAAQRDAAAAAARAEVARAEAERTEQQALAAERGMQVEEARREDSLRAADSLDPDVDHRSDDYRPGASGSREP